MTETFALPSAGDSPWTCPFCPLACDHLGVAVDTTSQTLTLQGGACVRASAALAQFNERPSAATPSIDGQPCSLDSALQAAEGLLRASRQPLFGGLGTDVAGARALYPLACATGAICEPLGGAALMHGLRALQDRGQFTATLSEVRTRADVIVFIGGVPADVAPLIGLRCGIGDAQVPQRRVVVLGPSSGCQALLEAWAGQGGVQVEAVPLDGDLFDTVSQLAVLVSGRSLPAAPPALQQLAATLRGARYGVLVGSPPRLPANGALVVEAVHQIVGSLNRSTRAAALWIGGGNGVATANQVFAWLSGLPLRSRLGPRGLEHEPLLFDAGRLLADGAVDALLWVSSFDATAAPPANALPMVVLGPPGMASRCLRSDGPTVFIPVTTPGIGSDGHLFRTDGTVLMPLNRVFSDHLPTVAEVAGRLMAAISQAERTTA
ncbi:formylmethanofuran dehydrogenase [Ideonella sp. A 288]|uniref:formylmethanofuran dehydrogenase n=1 Tax=Ideonella sp. A 288 TaxID=1962181 RepID=UPI000B4AF751|nr:formylmethanofuran dehydrogenase [Ideonella sp. A 288]